LNTWGTCTSNAISSINAKAVRTRRRRLVGLDSNIPKRRHTWGGLLCQSDARVKIKTGEECPSRVSAQGLMWHCQTCFGWKPSSVTLAYMSWYKNSPHKEPSSVTANKHEQNDRWAPSECRQRQIGRNARKANVGCDRPQRA
jgi:hypothetical protein